VYLLWQTAHDRQDHATVSVMDELTNQIEYGDRRRKTTIVPDWKPYLQQYTKIIKTYFSYILSKLKHARNQMTSDLYVLNKGNNKITELRTILQRKIQNS
jgi:hypothetical protein